MRVISRRLHCDDRELECITGMLMLPESAAAHGEQDPVDFAVLRERQSSRILKLRNRRKDRKFFITKKKQKEVAMNQKIGQLLVTSTVCTEVSAVPSDGQLL